MHVHHCILGWFLIFLLGRIGPVTSDSNVTISVEIDNPETVIVKELKKRTKMLNETLAKNTVHVFHMQLDKTDILDLMRIGAAVIDPDLYKKEAGPILEVSVSNGRDSFQLNLPVHYTNLTLYSDGKLLNPLTQEDFGPSKKKNRKGNSSITQNLMITVQSRLAVDVEYTLHITRLDRSQYDLKFKKDESTKIFASQHVTSVKPIGFFLDGVEQNVNSLHIKVMSNDDICAYLVTIPANESLYDRQIDSEEIDNRRILTFTRRADIFFSEAEVQMFKSFRIFVLISPTDSPCSRNSTRKTFNENKIITFEFTKLESSSYFYPTLLMFIFLAAPSFMFIPSLVSIARQYNSANSSQSNLIQFDPETRESSPDNTLNVPPNEETSHDIFIPSEQNDQIQEVVHSKEAQDSLSIHGEVLKYPVALILPVLMHTAVEFHKWTSTTMANRDEMCFHNHACAHPLGELRAWNNIISNVGYAIYGLVFIGITIGRRGRHQFQKDTGPFETTLLDVTIGVFMILQSIASATYHMCPCDVAFQFDTPCIQVICGLLIIRQWLVRQESPSPAYTNILLFGVLSLNFLISALSRNNLIRFLIAAIHLSTVGALCFKKRSTLKSATPMFRMFIIAFFIGNSSAILFYTTSYIIHLNQIATYCFILNCIMYLAYYASMKCAYRENITYQAKISGTLAVLGWVLAATFFFQDGTDWTMTAAESRALNKPCLLLNFFGSHDLWHLFGALAGLFTFLFVSFVDDDLLNTPRNSINLF